ncbi:hypothetical protein [Lutispora saccharofermentans]|uniref:Homing endonuclease LAGLIDADG domain-containing protein n=1 Tax=Lutispora saccharofermentans TaxID=3024236 RepID=A0ABT1NBB0_9FIRM|nr:hypothetical protein [Lutispora saccharofermentans]MCQ1528324.1 hypothetical protein [Lutispora saccharofermentans]
MEVQERAYIAGIIDGEGSIMLTRFHRNQHPAPCVTISSNSYELLLWIKQKTGLGRIITKKNYNPDAHKDSFTYITRYNEAISLLELIKPYLIIEQKRIRAHLILNEYKKLTPRNGRYSKEQLKAKEDLYEKFISV